MLFAIIAHDHSDHTKLRQTTRPDHLAYLESLGETLKFAGPFLDADGNGVGSLVVVEAQTLEQAKQIAENDPYAKANLFVNTQILPWRWSINNPDDQ